MNDRHERLMKRCVPKAELVDQSVYYGRCRNATEAKWDAKKNVFWYVREKFGHKFKECINHPEDDNGFDLFYPLERA